MPTADLSSSIIGLHHLSLTVSDLDASVAWYRRVLGLKQIGEDIHLRGRTVVLTQSATGFVILLQEHKAHEGTQFSEFRPGLDHLSFRVADGAELERWSEHLDSQGVEHQPVAHEPFGSVLIFRDLDRIQLELFADPPQA